MSNDFCYKKLSCVTLLSSFTVRFGIGICLNTLIWGLNIFLEQDVFHSLVSNVVVQHNLCNYVTVKLQFHYLYTISLS